MRLLETGQNSGWRACLVLGPAVVISGLALIGFAPLPQDPAYHAFADQRALSGVPHFWNVVSNVPFAVIGLLGCWWILRHGRTSAAFEEPDERAAYLVFFAGEFLTCFGSAYYHGGPTNGTLVWDRLVFSLMLTSMFAIVVAEFVDRRVGRFMLVPIVLLGLVSVLYWSYTEMQGRGDVRFYAVIQFYPILAMVMIFLLCGSRYTHSRLFALMWLLYGLAKVAEVYDRAIFDWSGIVSGHTLKHFVAACASYVPLYALQRRMPLRGADLFTGTRTTAAETILDDLMANRHGADRRARSRVTIRRWGVVVTLFYAIVVLALLVPGVGVLVGQSWKEAYAELYSTDQWDWLVWAGALITGQALLFVRVDRSSRKQRPRAHIAVTATAVGFATALLFFCAALAALAAVYGDDDWPGYLDDLVFSNVAASWLGLWVLWGIVFYLYYRRSPGGIASVIGWLLTGSILELLVAVPAHVIVRRRDECCAPYMTAFGIATGTAIMLMCFGPGVIALYQRRRKRYRTVTPRASSTSIT